MRFIAVARLRHCGGEVRTVASGHRRHRPFGALQQIMRERLVDALLRHPRRLGFFAFNLIALASLVGWIVTTQNDAETLGVFGLPFYALGYLAIGFLVAAWIIAWFAWFLLAARKRRQRQHDAQARGLDAS